MSEGEREASTIHDDVVTLQCSISCQILCQQWEAPIWALQRSFSVDSSLASGGRPCEPLPEEQLPVARGTMPSCSAWASSICEKAADPRLLLQGVESHRKSASCVV